MFHPNFKWLFSELHFFPPEKPKAAWVHLETKLKPFREHSVVSRTWKHNVLSTKKYTELVVFETKTIGQLKNPCDEQFSWRRV